MTLSSELLSSSLLRSFSIQTINTIYYVTVFQPFTAVELLAAILTVHGTHVFWGEARREKIRGRRPRTEVQHFTYIQASSKNALNISS